MTNPSANPPPPPPPAAPAPIPALPSPGLSPTPALRFRWLPWLPILLASVTITLCYFLPNQVVYNTDVVKPALNLIFSILVSFLIVFMAARTFLVSGTFAVLLLGTGMLAWGLSCTAMSTFILLTPNDDNAEVTIHNIGVCLTGCVTLLGAIHTVLPLASRPSWKPRTALAIAFAPILILVALATWATAAHLLPPFLIPDRSPTILRQFILGLAILTLASASLIFLVLSHLVLSAFLRWYALGLLLLALGLAGVFGQHALGTPLNWAGISTQFLGGAYLLVAVRIAARQTGRWTLPVVPPREIYQLYSTLVEQSPDAILLHVDGRFVFANPAAAALLGAPSPQDLLGRAALDFVHPDERPAVEARMHQNIAGQRVPLRQGRYLRLDGSIVHVEVTGAPVIFHGRPAAQIVLRDITARKLAEDALRQSEQRLNYHVENYPLAVIEWGPDMRLIRWSGAAERIFGWSASEVLGKRMEDFRWIYHEDQTQVADVSHDLQTGANPKRFSANRNYRKDGSVIDCEWYNSSLLDDHGKLRSILSLVLDVTDRKRAEDALLQAKAAAEAATRAKDQFIAVLSHELRTPLTPAVAAVSMLQTDPRLPADVLEDLAMVHRNLALEVRLIADLLDVSRIMSSKLHLEKRPVDVAAAIRQAAAIVQSDLDAKAQTLALHFPDDLCLAHADAARLQQVFWNLLRNAIKFSPEHSTISIHARLEPLEHCPLAAQPCPVGMGPCPLPDHLTSNGHPRPTNLVVSVTDTGLGIAPAMLPRIFNTFEQDPQARSFGGLGLGLSICKAVVEMHGGAISASSPGPGKGATFTVRLPVAQCPLPLSRTGLFPPVHPLASALAPAVPPLKILFVEDHPDTAKLMRRLLAAQGHLVTIASTVADARAAASQSPPDVLISDLGLPDGSGLDLIRTLRAQGHTFPALALSGYGTPADIQASKSAGFTDHLTKPLSVEALAAALAQLHPQPSPNF